MLAALSLLALHFQTKTFNLYRGAEIATPRYWDVTDTFLDAADPEALNGGSYTLLGGKGKTILIRFGDLNRVIGPHKKIVKASLFLTPSGGEAPVLHSVGRVLAPWGEGPRTVLANLFVPPKPGTKQEIPKWAANYRQRRTGYASWQSPGATGPEDVASIPGVRLGTVAKESAIEGLESAVQTMLDAPAENQGFALTFSSECEFSSSKSLTGRPRLEVECEDTTQPVAGPDLTVAWITRSSDGYTAHIRNAGDAAAKPFSVRWRIGEKLDRPIDVGDALAPGAETTVSIQRRPETSSTDHRLHPIGLKIIPNGPDSCAANNELDTYEDALPVDVVIGPDAAKSLGGLNMMGSHCPEDWVQAQVALWNDTYAAGSRFSFAPDGATERIRVNSIRTSSSSPDAGVVVDASADPLAADVPFLRRLGVAAGLLDGSAMNAGFGKVQITGSLSRAGWDLYPGLMGYGDTRFEGGIPGPIPLSYGPIWNPTLSSGNLEATDLLSATDVAALNRHLGQKPAKPSDDLLPIKNAIILRALSLDGRPLPNCDLLFFQSSNGSFPLGDPAFAVKTNDGGLAILNARGTAGPFGELDPQAGNGVFLVQEKTNGVLETGWLKAWQLTDAANRGATTTEIRLNLPDQPLDTSTNLALDRIITDSTNDLPAKLAGLIDDSVDTEVTLPDTSSSWVEIDLGRDRALGEVDLVTKGASFWKRFDITAYSTGQSPSEAMPWARELDWDWTKTNRSDVSGNTRVVAYRGPSQRFRYLRIVNRSGGPGSLGEIRVFAARG